MRILLILAFVLISQNAFSEVYVYTDKSSGEILFVTEKDNVVIDEKEKDSIEKTILPKDLEFYALTEAFTDYKLSGKKFVLNTAKISARENAITQQTQAEQARKAALTSAKEKLINLGLTAQECEAFLK